MAPSKALQGVLWMFLAACAASVLMNPGCECDSGHPPGAAQTQPGQSDTQLASQTQPAAQQEPEAGLTGAQTQAVEDTRKQAHEQAALLALGELKTLLAGNDYQKARDSAVQAGKDYADTLVAPEFAPLQQTAEQKLAEIKAAEDAKAAMSKEQADAEAKARHERFLRYRDEGEAAFKLKDYPSTIVSLQNALKEEEDPDARAMLDQAVDKTTKPRLAVAEFGVTGDVGIAEAGKSVAELLLGQFSKERFQLVERSRLGAILHERDLTIADVVDNPKVLTVKKVQGVRYLVVGTISRLGTLAISARMVDSCTGEITQTCDLYANDAVGLQMSLADVAAVLQMTDGEKAVYLAERKRQMDAVGEAVAQADAAAEEQLRLQMDKARRQREIDAYGEFQKRQHERDAMAALVDIKVLMVRRDFDSAAWYARWAVREYADTTSAQELADLQASAGAEIAALRDADALERARLEREMRLRHERFCRLRDEGMLALLRKDYAAAIEAFQNALKEENDPKLLVLLAAMLERNGAPGLAVLDFRVIGDPSMAYLGSAVADFIRARMPRDRYRVLDRDQTIAVLRLRGLTMGQVVDDPSALQGRKLPGVKYVIYGTIVQGSINVSVNMLDAASGQVVQTTTASVPKVKFLQDALTEAATVIQMSDQEKKAYTAQKEYQDWLARGDAAARAGQWAEALDAYKKAYGTRRTKAALEGMTGAAQNLAAEEKVRGSYDDAMAAAGAASKAGLWSDALEAYQRANSIRSTKEAREGVAFATHKIGDEQKIRALYDKAMAAAAGAMQAEKWDQALAAYQRAYSFLALKEAQEGITLVRRKIAAQQIELQYVAGMAAAQAAMQAGHWQEALDSYKSANAIRAGKEAQDGIALATRKLHADQQIRRLYDQAMAVAAAAMQAGQWQDALEAYRKAGAIQATKETQDGSALATQRLAAQRKALHDTALAEALAAAQAGKWQDALNAYKRANSIQATREAQDGIAFATQKLGAVEQNRISFDKGIAQAKAAVHAGRWQEAMDAYKRAEAIQSTKETQDGIALMTQKLAQIASSKKAVAQAFQSARKLLDDGKYQEALKALMEIQVQFPDTAQGEMAPVLIPMCRAHLIFEKGDSAAEQQKAAQEIAKARSEAKRIQTQNTDPILVVWAGDMLKDIDKLEGAGRAAAKFREAMDAARAALQAGKLGEAGKLLADGLAGLTLSARQEQERTALIQAIDQEKFRAAIQACISAGDALAKQGKDAEARAQYSQAARMLGAKEAEVLTVEERRTLLTSVNTKITALGVGQAERNKALHDKALAEAVTAAKAGRWQDALDAYKRADAIQSNKQTQDGIALATQEIAAAQKNKAAYDKALAEAVAAAGAKRWQEALDAYKRADAIQSTKETQDGIALMTQKLAGDKNKGAYDKVLAEAVAAAGAKRWAEALDAYKRADAIQSNKQTQDGIALATQEIAAAQKNKAAYDKALAEAAAAAGAKRWPEALDAYKRADAIQSNKQTQDGIALATQEIAAALKNKAAYDRAIADATAAVRAGKWQDALDAYKRADAIQSTKETQDGITLMAQKLAGDKNKAAYDKALAEAVAAAGTKRWQEALDAYKLADAIQSNKQTQDGIALATQEIAAAQKNKAGYDKALSEAVVAAGAKRWPEALDAYKRADAIQSNRQTQDGIALATQEIAAALKNKAAYDKALSEAVAAAKAGRWQEALDAYKRADAIQSNKQTQDGIALATQEIAAALKNKAGYDRGIADATAAVRAGKWQDALDAYKRADAIQSTKETQDGITLMTQKLAGDKNKGAYDKALAEAVAAAGAKRWQEALDAYKRADAIQSSKQTQDGIALATEKLAGDKRKRAEYDKAIVSAREAMAKGDYKAAWDAINQALGLIPDGPEVKALQEQLGPTLTIVAEVDGVEHKGAQIAIDGNTQKLTTPATFRLKKGTSYQIEVRIPSTAERQYTSARTTVKPDKDAPAEFRAALKILKVAPKIDPPPVKTPGHVDSPPAIRVTPTSVPASLPTSRPASMPVPPRRIAP